MKKRIILAMALMLLVIGVAGAAIIPTDDFDFYDFFNLYNVSWLTGDNASFNNIWQGSNRVRDENSSVNLSFIDNADFQCPADTSVTNFNASNESVICTTIDSMITDIWVDVSGDNMTGPLIVDDWVNASYFNGTYYGDGRNLIISTTYNATSIATAEGTLDDGNLASVQSIDSNWYNVSEDAGGSPLLVYVNFTGVSKFGNILLRTRYDGGLGHEIEVSTWNYDNGAWENHGDITDQSTMTELVIDVLDSSDHVSGSLVQLKFDHVQNGVATHDFRIDYVALQDGFTTVTSSVHDSLLERDDTDNHPWALPRDGTKNMTGPLNTTALTIQGFGDGLVMFTDSGGTVKQDTYFSYDDTNNELKVRGTGGAGALMTSRYTTTDSGGTVKVGQGTERMDLLTGMLVGGDFGARDENSLYWFYFDANRNLALGSTDPEGYKLNVNGTINSNDNISAENITARGYMFTNSTEEVCSAENKKCEEAVTDIWVNESGDTMTGPLNMSDNNITDIDYLIFKFGELIDNIVDGWMRITGGLNVTKGAIIGGNLTTGNVTIVDGNSLSLQEDITFTGATGENLILIPDNLAQAFVIQEGANAYINFDTTNGGEVVTHYKNTTFVSTTIETMIGQEYIFTTNTIAPVWAGAGPYSVTLTQVGSTGWAFDYPVQRHGSIFAQPNTAIINYALTRGDFAWTLDQVNVMNGVINRVNSGTQIAGTSVDMMAGAGAIAAGSNFRWIVSITLDDMPGGPGWDIITIYGFNTDWTA